MAKGDLAVVGNAPVTPTFTFARDDRTTSTELASAKAGEPLQAGGTGNNFTILLITGEPVQASSNRFIGIARKESDETASVDGHVDIEVAIPLVTVLEARATTVGNVDTLAKWDALQNDTVTLDGISALTGNTVTTPYTIDENEGDDPNDHGLVMVGWDILRPTFIQFVVKPLVTLFGNNL